MGRVLLAFSLCCLLVALGEFPSLRGQEPADKKLQELADASRARAERLQVKVVVGGQTTKVMLRPDPVMKYTDAPRQIEMATLWVWEDDGQPVALGKVEAYRQKDRMQWVYCFASTSTGLVEAKWPEGHRFEASKAGVEWTTLKGPVPDAKPAGRLRQMKELFRRFSATARDEALKTSDELRPLARPLHEYSSPKHGVAQGILCGLTANGTNPDVIVALEAVSGKDDKGPPESWRYGVICMTATGVSVKLDKDEVFKRAFTKAPGDQDNWTWFLEGALAK